MPDAATAYSSPPSSSGDSSEDALQERRLKRRNALFKGLAAVIATIAAAAILWQFLYGANHMKTDNAYVGASVAQITPQVTGAILKVPVNDNDAVKKGDALVVIDPADAKLALAAAEAQYAQTLRRVQGYFAGTEAARATVRARSAEINRADAMVSKAKADLDEARKALRRREALAKSGAVSGEEVSVAKQAYLGAEANLAAAQFSLAQAQANKANANGEAATQSALTAGTTYETNPEAAAAKAALEVARLNLDRTVIRAPIDGVVAQNKAQIGQRVAIGQSLMIVAPLEQAYIDANFKEEQLRKIKIGQNATVTSDLYGSGVKYHGHVTGIGGGTGSAFSIIPAQNATGNWIKVVQRVPVRIQLDPEELREHPLRIGLSMNVDIDVKSSGSNDLRSFQ